MGSDEFGRVPFQPSASANVDFERFIEGGKRSPGRVILPRDLGIIS
jgi:hypothetical protein